MSYDITCMIHVFVLFLCNSTTSRNILIILHILCLWHSSFLSNLFILINYCYMLCITVSGEYKQNICTSTNVSCQVCSERLPDCRGRQDGAHAFPNKPWQRDFIQCYLNRTISIAQCPMGMYFNPRTPSCKRNVEPGKK